jgi:hypothetical protein
VKGGPLGSTQEDSVTTCKAWRLAAVSLAAALVLAGCGGPGGNAQSGVETLEPRAHGPSIPGSAPPARPVRTSQAALDKAIAEVPPEDHPHGSNREVLLTRIRDAYPADRPALMVEYLQNAETLPPDQRRRALKQLETATQAKSTQ